MATTKNNILALRSAGYSQTKIAELTGIPQPRISRWESGDVPASADDALKIAALVRGLEAPAAPDATPYTGTERRHEGEPGHVMPLQRDTNHKEAA